MDNESTKYVVGYGRPPAATQFSKGVSGNPSGRPKGSKNLMTVILQESRQPVRVNGPKGGRKVTKLQAMAMQLGNKSAQGDLKAIRDFFTLVLRAEEVAATLPESTVTSEVDQKVMLSILKRIRDVGSDSEGGE